MDNKKSLILGGAGFIGLNLTKSLLDTNHKVTIVDNFSRGKKDEVLEKLTSDYPVKLTLISADLTDSSQYKKFDSEFDEVYVLASVVGVEYTQKMPDKLLFINTSIIINTCEWLKSSNCKRVLFTSTSENYVGAVESYDYKVPTDEKVPCTIIDTRDSRFTYAATKILGESFFSNYARKYGFEAVIVRYHNVYGPRMGFKHVIPQVVQRILKKERPFKIYNGDHTRAFNFISDAIEGTIQVMKKGVSGEIYHIGDPDSEITIFQLIEFICKEMNFETDFVEESGHSGSVTRRAPDISKAKLHLGYSPKVNWQDGIKETINWYNHWLETNDPFE